MNSSPPRVVPTLTEVLEVSDLETSDATLSRPQDDSLLSSAWADSEVLDPFETERASSETVTRPEPWPDLGIGTAETALPEPLLPVDRQAASTGLSSVATEALMQGLSLRMTPLVDEMVDQLLSDQAQARLRQDLERVVHNWVTELSMQLAPVLEQRLHRLLKETLQSPR